LEKPDVFQKWETHNKDYLNACRKKRLIVTFSGGKDSSACLFLLHKAKDQYNYDLEAHLYAYPRHIYKEGFKEDLLSFWGKYGVKLFFHPPEEDDSLLEHQEDPCIPCRRIRKKALFRLWSSTEKSMSNLVIVTGHSLWDLASYILEIFIARELADYSHHENPDSAEKFIEISQRFCPFIPMREGYAVFRPMLCLNQKEIEHILKTGALPALDTPCRYSRFRPKKVLGNYLQTFGCQFSYKKIIEFAQERIGISDISKIKYLSQKEYLSCYF
jgi:tRNA(Ile)-lysidine synthase TilS/MesJ